MMSATDEVDVHRMGNLFPGIRLFQKLVEHRRQLVEDKRGFVNRLINTFMQYYPYLLE